ncbi:hypothetical protein R83H12_00072 [Fibrobacteria bacterium R8-3-H12]
MRKLHQKQILDLLKTLDKAIDEIKRLLKKEQISTAINLLADCQDSVLNICEFIEEMHSKGTKTAGLLTEFSEMLYNASTEIDNENARDKFVEQLKNKLRIISNSVNNELKPNKIEIAFFPYKASMWDSLESIYLAAKEDPACDAYVVPIPYYDRLPGGAFGEMHYEGREYPSNIPVADWQAYNVEERKPDIIFVHNPYDESNYVTSVHPNFYCQRLMNLTDCLVYVPYFVCVGDKIQEHFCALPGTFYAHKVIVQSESIRQSYIKYFKEFEKKNNCRAVFGKPEDKFVALGSPKFDKVINSKPEDFKLPPQWRQLIMKPDGTKKKVFFYNTTIAAILESDEKYLQKIRHVLGVFRNAPDIVLLWRPHPLNEATYQAMRPRLLDEYEQIIEDYKRDGWGIFDDSSDLHRAVAWSNVYYGDMSSVVALFDAVGKPVVVQRVGVRERESLLDRAFFWHFIIDNDIWFCDARLNILLKMNIETWEPEYMGNFGSSLWKISDLYTSGVLHNGNLYLAPLMANEIAEYDIQKKTITYIPCGNIKGGENFVTALNYGKYIFFIPYKYEAIMRLDTESKEIAFFDDWVEPLKRLTTDEKKPFFAAPLRITENIIMLASYRANAVVEFNMETLKSKVYEIGQKSYRYNGICFDGKDYWLFLWNGGSIIKWNPNIGVIKEFTNIAEGNFYENIRCFCSIIFCEGYIWLFPHYSKQTFKINVKTDEISKVEEFEPSFIEGETRIYPTAYVFALNIGDVIYAYAGKDGTFIEYDCKTQKKQEKILKYSPSVLEKIKQSVLCKDMAKCQKVTDCYYYEYNYFALSDYINSEINDCNSAKKQLFGVMNSNADGTAGKKIFNALKTIFRQ